MNWLFTVSSIKTFFIWHRRAGIEGIAQSFPPFAMGNESSQLKGLQIDKKSIEVTDFWSLYAGSIPNGEHSTQIAVFQAEPVVTGQLWTCKSPLERATKNLMIYRHPSILRFIAAWEKGSMRFLATEPCRPLSLAVSAQTDIQVCLGLRNILCSLIFLLERADVRHLNVCAASVYVTPTGGWRLHGFEHLWPAKEVNATLLERSQSYRYKAAIDPNETKRDRIDGLEQYSFAVLCEEILKHHKATTAVPNVNEFRQYCAEHLRHATLAMRPKLSAVLLHPYFNHEFVLIHSFLTELPLKSQLEKQTFFTSLIDRLRDFDEQNVAVQLTDLVLSRMVVLDDTAKLCVIPFVLRPRMDADAALSTPTPLFSVDTFIKYIIPKVQQLFLVRDSQIRLILLEYFAHYVSFFPSKELIIDEILPQLLLGIREGNNETIVAMTLRALADLIPILGSAVVIGRNRGRLFGDGRPNGAQEKMTSATSSWACVPRSITPVINAVAASDGLVSGSPLRDAVDISDSYVSMVNSHNDQQLLMPERLSPDGGEDVQTASEQPDIEDDGWSDWEDNQEPAAHTTHDHDHDTGIISIGEVIAGDVILDDTKSPPATNHTTAHAPQTTDLTSTFIKDIKELDIKTTKPPVLSEIDDMFKDMEPVIASSSGNPLLMNGNATITELDVSKVSRTSTKAVRVDRNRFAMTNVAVDDDALADDDAWGHGDNDWDVED